jgi:hypothetical protein
MSLVSPTSSAVRRTPYLPIAQVAVFGVPAEAADQRGLLPLLTAACRRIVSNGS